MAAYEYKPLSHGGVAVQGGIYLSWYEVDNGPLRTREMAPVEATVTGRGQSAVRGQPQGLTFELHVHLNDLNQSSLDAFYALFNEDRGVVYHRMTDGSAVTWRIAVRQLAVRAINPNHFVVVLRAASGIWEADAATTVSHLNIAGDSQAISPTNAGNRKARPVITITPDLVKTNDIQDYKWSFRGFFVNRAPKAWNDAPVWLFDQTAAAARFATDTSAAGATVLQTTGLTTITLDITAGVTTINLTSGAAWPVKGMGYITDTRGNGFHDQFYYTGNAANQLTGVVWLAAAIGGGSSNPGGIVRTAGGIAHTVAQVSAIQPSGTLLSGDDVRVIVDDVEVNRWLVAWNTTLSDVVVNLTAPPVVKKTLVGLVTVASTSVDFTEGALDLPVPGFLAFENEIIYYTTKTARGVQGMVRGVHSTTAANHGPGTFAYGNPLLYTVTAGKAQAGSPPCPASKRPCVQLTGSNNANWLWGDQANDPSTIYYDGANPGRTAQWTPGFDKDGNDISPLLQLSASGTIATFRSSDPGDGSPVANFLEQSFPMAVRTGTTAAITNNWTPTVEELNLELFVRDAANALRLVDQLQQSAAAPGRALPAALVGLNYGVKLKARYNIVTGHKGSGNNVNVSNTVFTFESDGVVAQQFVLDQETPISAIGAELALASGAVAVVVQFVVFNDVSGAPGTTGREVFSAPTLAVTSTTPTLYRFSTTTAATLPAGTYWFLIARTDYAVEVVWSTKIGARFARGVVKRTAGAWLVQQGGRATTFYIEGTYGAAGRAPIQTNQPIKTNAGARTLATASMDNTAILWQLAETPYVHRVGAFANGLVHENGVMASATTGEGFALDKWMLPGANIVIDCNLRTAVYTENGVPFPAKANVASVNPAEWLTLDPGVNSWTFTEPNMRQHDVVTVFRAVKV